MLSRVANSLFWSSRYTQRAEQLTRTLAVTRNYSLELQGVLPNASEACWSALADLYQVELPEDPEHLIHRLAFDTDLPSSVLSCVIQSRENARSIRDAISSELWQCENTLYHRLNQTAASHPDPAADLAVLTEVNVVFHTLHGLRDHTMSRSEEWQFMRLGRFLERADGTLSVVDHMYSHPALQFAERSSLSIDSIHLASTLKLCTGFESFSKRVHQFSPEHVAGFLLLDEQFPQSVAFSVAEVAEAFRSLAGLSAHTRVSDGELIAGRLMSDQQFMTIEEIFRRGLNTYVSETRAKLQQLGTAIDQRYFG